MTGKSLNVMTYTSNKETVFGNGIHGIHSSKFVKEPSRRKRIQIKKIIVIIFLLVILPSLLASGVKVVYITDNIKVEENVFKATTIRNLSEIEIYFSRHIYLIDNFIYLLDLYNYRVFKLSLQGNLVSQRVEV